MMRALVFAVALLCAACGHAATVPTLPELVAGDKFTILVDLLKLTSLLDTVVSTPGLTIFAPTDMSFKRTAMDLGCPAVSTKPAIVACLSGLLVTNGDLTLLKKVLTYHVVPGGARPIDSVLRVKLVETLEGSFIKIGRGSELVDLTAGAPNARVVLSSADLRYNNGYVHVVDRVLLPLNGLLSARDPCNAFDDVVVTQTGRFVALDTLELVARRCAFVRNAVRRCPATPACGSGRALRYVYWGFSARLTLGDVVAAVTTCPSAASVVMHGC